MRSMNPESRNSGFDAAHRPGMTAALIAREPGKFLDHPFVDRPLERDDQLGKVLHRLPAPVDEFSLVAAAGIRHVDFMVLAGESHREPLLALAAIASLP